MSSALESMKKIVRAIMAHVDYYAPYSAVVVRQDDDGTLELRPDNAKVPPQVKIPIRVPRGLRLEVDPGARVMLEFENGDPSRPYATLFEIGQARKITLDATVEVTVKAPLVNLGDEGGRPVAGVGDAIAVSLELTPGTPITVYGTIVGGGSERTRVA